jgi:hypothetical protein
VTDVQHCDEVIFKGASKYKSGLCIGIQRETESEEPMDIVKMCLMEPSGEGETYQNVASLLMTPREAVMIAGNLIDAGLRGLEVWEKVKS